MFRGKDKRVGEVGFCRKMGFLRLFVGVCGGEPPAFGEGRGTRASGEKGGLREGRSAAALGGGAALSRKSISPSARRYDSQWLGGVD